MSSIHFRIFLTLIFILLCWGGSVGAQANRPAVSRDSAAVRRAAESFLQAFRDLEWEKFTRYFADDATAFFPPSAHYPRRANGKAEIEKVFKVVFNNARRQRSAPPYLIINPEDIEIQMLKNVAIVTFHLDDPGLFGRRTVVFQKRKGKWLIVHLHASGVPAN